MYSIHCTYYIIHFTVCIAAKYSYTYSAAKWVEQQKQPEGIAERAAEQAAELYIQDPLYSMYSCRV